MPNPTIHLDKSPDVRPTARRSGSLHYPLPSPDPRPPVLLGRRMTAEGAALRLPQPVRGISEDGIDISALQRTLPQIEAGLSAMARSTSPLSPPASPRHLPSRAPSPLPALPELPLPSDIRALTTRLLGLVQQSNSYVAGLSRRLEVVEAECRSMGVAANSEQLATFLEMRPPFATLDPARLEQFGLPLCVWERIADQLVNEYEDEPGRGLESVLYWRGRAEAEALGLLHSDYQRSSSDDSRRSTAQSMEWFISEPGSRRGSRASSSTSSRQSLSVPSPRASRPLLGRAGSSFGPPRAMRPLDEVETEGRLA